MRILNLGAGVQSTTLYLMVLRHELDPIDVAIFADTQEEPADVYRHLAWLESLNGPRILRCTAGKLGDDLVKGMNSTNQRFATIPAFGAKDGVEQSGMMRRQCSREYKVDVIDRTIRRDLLGLKPGRRVPKGVRVTQLYGISADEARRAKAIRARSSDDRKWSTPEFPLLDRFMTRADCYTWLAKYGVPHQVPKSACVFCPYHTDATWDILKTTDPAGWARAVEIDRALREASSVMNKHMVQVLYLHKSCKPLDAVELNPQPRDRQLAMSFYQECEGVCGV